MIPKNAHDVCRNCDFRGPGEFNLSGVPHVECRRLPAAVVGVHGAFVVGAWPMPPADGACGEFKRSTPAADELVTIDGPAAKPTNPRPSPGTPPRGGRAR